ncbi:hypothetical protein [Microscilla marina]|uniref:Lipoprotein, putative n=1 Tax=Microscilla marina ATCC 23134 TaxID=313606 RepID=A1ZI05_MICM2|nr:hypothetical protein [Microscilla marina]EAY30162.1 lipoprotein, putative [Microscilla marina ATCC 23134]
MQMLQKALFLLLIGGLFACECLETTQGIVLDYASKTPLVKVHIYPVRRAQRTHLTDSSGRFEVSFVSGFFEKNGCKKTMMLVLSKPGYDSLRVTLKNQRPGTLPDTLFLRRRQD